MYKVIVRFADLTDKNYIYEVGDAYPRKGLEVSERRISELLGSDNKLHKPIIEKSIVEAPEASEEKSEVVKPVKKKKTE